MMGVVALTDGESRMGAVVLAGWKRVVMMTQ